MLMARVFSLVLLTAVVINANAQQAPADLVFVNGAVYTVDINRSWAEAVAVRGQHIVYVGNNEGAMALAGPATRVVELDGKMLLPGFQDAHAHPASSGLIYLSCPLFGLGTAEAFLAKVAECVRDKPDQASIDGGGWSMDAFPGGLPDKRLLDAIEPNRPVALESQDGHSLWVNSKALELAGIDENTRDPEGGRIDRYPGTQEPSGSLQEEAAIALVTGQLPPLTSEQRVDSQRFAQLYFNQYGVTSAQDAIIKLYGQDAFNTASTYQAMDRAGDLTMRITGALYWNSAAGLEQIDELVAARARLAGTRFSAPTVKIMLDGVLEVHTAAMLEPYLDRLDESSGDLLVEPALLNRAVTRLDALGFQVHFHAIGDRAIRVALDSLAAAREANGARDSRHHLSHIQAFDPADLQRFRELNAVANFQPLWAWADAYITDLTIPKLGPERSAWMYPIGRMMDSGAVVAFGSDWSVSTGNPLPGIETAITRRDASSSQGAPFNDDDRIGLPEAIAAYTINSAYVNFQEQETGSIEVGKLADMIVLDRNLFAIPVSEISEADVLLTLLDGEPVYGDWSLTPQEKTAP